MIEKYMFTNCFKANTSNTPQLLKCLSLNKANFGFVLVTTNQVSFLKLKKK